MAITRLWFFNLQPNVSASDPAFTRLWADVLELCALYTPAPGPSSLPGHVAHLSQPHPKRPHHFLFHSSAGATTNTGPGQGGAEEPAGSQPETVFVLISTYPSFALLSQADAAYTRQYQPQMFDFVRHRALRQMDLEDTEVVPRLLSSPLRKATGAGGGGGSGGGRPNGAAATITVTISDHDPLRSEVAESMSSPGGRTPVPPPDVEISGADVYVLPSAPAVAIEEDGNGGKDDMFRAQRGEGRKWVRISRRPEAGEDDGNVEVFRLQQLMSR